MWAACRSPAFKLHFPADLAQFLEVWQCVCVRVCPMEGVSSSERGLEGEEGFFRQGDWQ